MSSDTVTDERVEEIRGRWGDGPVKCSCDECLYGHGCLSDELRSVAADLLTAYDAMKERAKSAEEQVAHEHRGYIGDHRVFAGACSNHRGELHEDACPICRRVLGEK